MPIQELTRNIGTVPYDFNSGPLSVNIDSPDQMNCQSLAHYIYGHLKGSSLPLWMRSLEIYHDTNFFIKVDSRAAEKTIYQWQQTGKWNPNKWQQFTNKLEEFDTILFANHNFGIEKRYLPQYYHIGIVLDVQSSQPPLIAHFTQPQYYNGDSSIFNSISDRESSLQFWPIDSTVMMSQYSEIMGVRRLKGQPTISSYLLEQYNQNPEDPFGLIRPVSSPTQSEVEGI